MGEFREFFSENELQTLSDRLRFWSCVLSLGAYQQIRLLKKYVAFNRFYPKISLYFTVFIDTNITIYISYCGVREESKNKVITFAKHLKVDNVELYLDILHQTTIDSIGGFPFWVKEKMSVADRIILILTPDYLEVN